MIYKNTSTVYGSKCQAKNKQNFKDIETAKIADKWQRYKDKSQEVSKLFLESGIKSLMRRSYKISECSEVIHQIYNKKTGTWKKHVIPVLCRDRLCPICQWRLAIKRKAILEEKIQQIETQLPELNIYFVTLTVRNCLPNQLRETIKDINYSYKKFIKNLHLQKNISGVVKKIEITKGVTDSRTVHPHFHLILVSEKEINKAEIQKEWKRSAKLEYFPQVDIKKSNEKTILEIAKYMSKEEVKKTISGHFLISIAEQIQGLRMFTCSGIFKNSELDDVKEFEKNEVHKGKDLPAGLAGIVKKIELEKKTEIVRIFAKIQHTGKKYIVSSLHLFDEKQKYQIDKNFMNKNKIELVFIPPRL